MKKTLLFMLIAVFGMGQLAAHEGAKLRKQYLNFSYVSQTIDFPAMDNIPPIYGEYQNLLLTGSYDSKYGAALTYGRTFFLHRKPLGGTVRFGLDVTFIDLNAALYETTGTEDDGLPFQVDMYQAEAGMGIGPSVTVNPHGKLNIHAYARYAPSYSVLHRDDHLSANYVGFIVTGGAVYWGVIGVGAEARFGKGRYRDIGSMIADQIDEIPDEYISGYESRKLNTSGIRAYLTLRF